MIGALALAAALTAGTGYESCITRGSHGRISRSTAMKRSFAKQHACPSNGEFKLPCPGYRIDHITPLKRCGADIPENMQWLTIEEWKAKTRWE